MKKSLPLIGCLGSIVGASLLFWFSAAELAQAEAERASALDGVRNASAQLTRAREAEAARESRTKRLLALKTALAGKVDTEQILRQLSAHPHVDTPTLDVQDTVMPSPAGLSMTIRHIQIEASLLHEDALLALNSIVMNSTAHLLPAGCSLHRQAAPFALRARCSFDWIVLSENQGST